MSTINTNIQSLTTAMTLERNQGLLGNAMEELSSGSSLVNPGTDPQALSDSDSLGADNQRLGAASTNVQDTVSYVQTADSYLSAMSSMLNRMSELASESTDPTKNPSDIANYEAEYKSLQDELRTMIGGSPSAIGGSGVSQPSATFNGTNLFGSTAAGGLTVGIGDSASAQLTVPDIDLQTGAMQALIGKDTGGAYTSSSTDSSAVAAITAALAQVGNGRATIGAVESRLTLESSSLAVQQQNIASAISDMGDVDVAKVSTELAKYSILTQAGASMLAQANLQPGSVLKLIHS